MGGLHSSFQILGPAPRRFCSPAPRPSLLEPGEAERGRSQDQLGMGGTSRSRARPCHPPYPTLPRDRKAEPRLPEPRLPLPAVAVFGWWWPNIFAGDGRGCRYGDRSVALGAASLRKQNCRSPYTPPPASSGTPCRFNSRQVRVKIWRREGSCSVWKGEGSLAFSESDMFAGHFSSLAR